MAPRSRVCGVVLRVANTCNANSRGHHWFTVAYSVRVRPPQLEDDELVDDEPAAQGEDYVIDDDLEASLADEAEIEAEMAWEEASDMMG